MGISHRNRKEGYQQNASIGEKMLEKKAYGGECRSRGRMVIGWPGCDHGQVVTMRVSGVSGTSPTWREASGCVGEASIALPEVRRLVHCGWCHSPRGPLTVYMGNEI